MPEARAACGLDVMVFALALLAAAIAPSLFKLGIRSELVSACMLEYPVFDFVGRVLNRCNNRQNIMWRAHDHFIGDRAELVCRC